MTILGIDPGIATVGYGLIQYENGSDRDSGGDRRRRSHRDGL